MGSEKKTKKSFKSIEEAIRENADYLSSIAGKTVHIGSFFRKTNIAPSSEIGQKIANQFGITFYSPLFKNKEVKMEEKKNQVNSDVQKSEVKEVKLDLETLKKLLLEVSKEGYKSGVKELKEEHKKKRQQEEEVKKQKQEIEQEIIQDLAKYCLLNPNDPRCQQVKTREDLKKLINEMKKQEVEKIRSSPYEFISPKARGDVIRIGLTRMPFKVASIVNEIYNQNPESVREFLKSICESEKCFKEIENIIKEKGQSKVEEKSVESKNPFIKK